MHKLGNAVDEIVRIVSISLTGCLFLITGAGVFWRYVLNEPLKWTEEAGRLVYLWIVFLGAVMLAEKDQHLQVTLLVDRLPQRSRQYLALGSDGLVSVLLCITIITSWPLLAVAYQIPLPALHISSVWTYLPLIVSSALMLGHLVPRMIRRLCNLMVASNRAKPGADREVGS